MSTKKRLLYSFLAALVFEGAMIGVGYLSFISKFYPMTTLIDWIHQPCYWFLHLFGWQDFLWLGLTLMVLIWTLLFFTIVSWKYWKYDPKAV